jgi:hypothetical protein
MEASLLKIEVSEIIKAIYLNDKLISFSLNSILTSYSLSLFRVSNNPNMLYFIISLPDEVEKIGLVPSNISSIYSKIKEAFTIKSNG